MKVVLDEFTSFADTKLLMLDVPAVNLAGIGFEPPQEIIDYFTDLFSELNKHAMNGKPGIRSNLCVIEYKRFPHSDNPELSFSLKLDGFKVEVVVRDKGKTRFVLEKSHADDPAFHRETVMDPVGHEKVVYVRNGNG
jgi:hypothetical protein